MSKNNGEGEWDQKSKPLNVDRYNVLLKWLRDHKIPTEKLNKDFSDAVLMAKLLKGIIPKQIDVHNYPPCNSLKSKLLNWETMNTKVFAKLNMKLSKSLTEKLAKSEPGNIEIVLMDVMLFEEEKLANAKKAVQLEMSGTLPDNDDIIMVSVNKQMGDAIIQIPQKMINYSLYEQSVKDLNANRVCLTAAHQKIAHLENLLDITNANIDEIIKQIHLLSNGSPRDVH
ncbi:sperm flagellar protein 1-like [Teleopsis dalmanni]|uniref:sperm flagellar protein 1-like n=1 Tax=Teleopsis dalmanni TaxID=139649 RepID=UPI0018CE3001|nr:sperm flagellar protein 1-like [Teleopsis dalmanni]